MARVTVEDCIDKVKDRFELVAVAAQRAKNIASGAPLMMERNNEKNTVLSLREIGDNLVEVDDLREDLVAGFQQERPIEDIAEDELDAAGAVSPESVDAEVKAVIADEQDGEAATAEVEAGDFSFAEDNLDVDD